MMSSKTNLNILDLPNIFQSLSDNRRTGTLRVKSKGQEKLVYFHNGNINLVHTPMKATQLGEALVRTKVIDEDTLRDAVNHQKTSGCKLGESLIQMKKISPEDLVKALTFQVTEEVCELFTWEDIFCEFVSGDPQPGTFELDDISRKISLPAPPLLMEAARRIDEWDNIRKTLPSMKDVLVIKKKPNPEFRGTLREELLKWVDGLRDVEEILERARMSRFNALKSLKSLTDEGYIRTRSSRELVEAAKIVQQKGRGDHDSGISKIIKLYERAEELGINNPKLSLWLAKAYERLSKQKESVTRYKTLGRVSLDKGDLDDAIGHYRKIVAMNPDDIESHEKLVETLLQTKLHDAAAIEGAELLRKFRNSGRSTDGLQMAVRLEKVSDGNPDLIESLAELYVDAGDRIQGIILFESLAEHHEAEENAEAAVRAYARMLEIDQENIDAHFRMAGALTRLGRIADAVKRYKTLADTLGSSGVLENSINWQFLVNVYEHLVALEPGNLLAREWLADAYISKGEEAKAIENLKALQPLLAGLPPGKRIQALRKLVDLAPEDISARRDLAVALVDSGDKVEAVAELAELGQLCLRNNDLKMAAEAFEQAAGLDPNDDSIWEGLSRVLLLTGRPQDAASALRDAASLSKVAGRIERSIGLLKSAFEADPDRLDSLLDMTALMMRKEDAAAAQSALKTYVSRSLSRLNLGDARRACFQLLALSRNDSFARETLAALEAMEKAAKDARKPDAAC